MTGFDSDLSSWGAFSAVINVQNGADTPYGAGWSIQINNENAGVEWVCNHATIIAGTHVTLKKQNTFITFSGDAGTTAHVSIGHSSPNGRIRAWRGGNSSGTLLGESEVIVDGWHYVETKVVLHDTAGSVVVMVDGVEVLNLSGIDTKNGGTASTIDRVKLWSETVDSTRHDDFYLLDGAGSEDVDFWGPIRISTLVPSGNGNSSGMVGSDGNSADNYLLVDEGNGSLANAADYVASGTSGTKDTYPLPDLNALAQSVRAVQYGVNVAKTDSGTLSLRRIIRKGGVDLAGADLVVGASFVWYNEMLPNTPDGGVDWTVSDVNGIEIGFEVRP